MQRGLIALVGLLGSGCDLASKTRPDDGEHVYWGEGYSGGDTHSDTGSEIVCEASLTISFPDGTSIEPEYCTSPWLRTEYEYEAGVPPKIRNLHLRFAATAGDGAGCWIEVREPGVCSEGFYCVAESAGEVRFDTTGCADVGSGFQGAYTAATGFIRLDTLRTGDEPSKFSRAPFAFHILVPTTVAGRIEIASAEGIRLSGAFSMTQALPVVAAGETICTVRESESECESGDTAADPDD